MLWLLWFVRLKPKIYSFLVANNEHKKAKGMNKNVVETIDHYEHKNVLLKNKYLRHSMNRIQSEDHSSELIKSTKFQCLVLMTKCIFKTMEMMD